MGRASTGFRHPAEAARQLGTSVKTLRLYEQLGLLAPARTAAGWRAYGPDDLARAADILALRRLGLTLAQIARVIDGDALCLDTALAAHQCALEVQIRQTKSSMETIVRLRAELAQGRVPQTGAMPPLSTPTMAPAVALDLPWPWGGERFELTVVRPLTYITGPLGCGKTRLAIALAKALPGAVFLPMDRPVGALTALLAASNSEDKTIPIIDAVEQGLDQVGQEALSAHLRLRQPGRPPVIMTTRSTAILDLAKMGRNETIIFCPANHSVPRAVLPYPGAAGYEALTSCLASPAVRARTAGMVASVPT